MRIPPFLASIGRPRGSRTLIDERLAGESTSARPFRSASARPYNPREAKAARARRTEGTTMRGLMQHEPLTLTRILDRAVTMFPRQQVVTKTPDGVHRETFEEM